MIPLIDRVMPRYAMFMLAAPTMQRRMAGHVKGTSYVGINLREVRALRLPVPDVDTQGKVIEKLDFVLSKTQEAARNSRSARAALDAMLPSLLDRAFKGELSGKLPSREATLMREQLLAT